MLLTNRFSLDVFYLTAGKQIQFVLLKMRLYVYGRRGVVLLFIDSLSRRGGSLGLFLFVLCLCFEFSAVEETEDCFLVIDLETCATIVSFLSRIPIYGHRKGLKNVECTTDSSKLIETR